MSETSTVPHTLDVLHMTQDTLAAALGGLGVDQVTAPSYCDEWTIAQVASHLGSGSEIFRLHLAAGLSGEESPGNDAAEKIWAVWNAKDPVDQARDGVASSAALLGDLDALTDDQRAQWRLELWGMDLDLAGFLRLRAAESIVHTWDITVASDPASTIPAEAAELVLANLPMIVGFAGQKNDEQVSVEIRTTDPERAFHLDLGPGGVGLTPSSDDTASSATLTLPAESLVRLVYGRLDAAHTPSSVRTTGVDLDLLRRTFPGV